MPRLVIEVEIAEELLNDVASKAALADIVAQEAYEAAYMKVIEGEYDR